MSGAIFMRFGLAPTMLMIFKIVYPESDALQKDIPDQPDSQQGFFEQIAASEPSSRRCVKAFRGVRVSHPA